MKLSKRFSLLKKSLGLTLLAPCILVCVSCNNLTSVPTPTMTATASKTLSAPVFPEHTKNDDGSLIDNITYGERYYTVSQGLKRKISFSWNAVEIAKYYEVFAAQNINDDFVKVGETSKAEFEDSVASGATFYYKVRAVSNKGQYSDFSSIVKGTSLATPAVTDISITDTSATVFWYMGNVGIDSYAKNLVYEIHAKGEIDKVATVKAWNQEKQSIVEEYTFDGLGGNVEYTFQVFAYITSEQDSVEKSPEVSKKTLALYTPVSPEFTATQGESINYIKLFITLPSKIQVNTSDSSGTEKDFDYPICFEIQRKRSTEENWKTIVPCLYYNATTTAPASDTAYDAYKEGNVIEYDDKIGSTSASIARGAKYDYRILSCIDRNYATVKGHAFNAIIKSKEALANTAQGWAAARPEFRVRNLKRNINSSGATPVVDSVSLGFEAKWNDMGKAADYKYAIEYNRTFNNGASTEETWLMDSELNVIFDTAEQVSSIQKVYDLKNNEAAVEGTYRYTLYVFPATCTAISGIKSSALDKVTADNIIGVSTSATDPIRDLKAEGGWTDRILLTWTVEDEVDYKIDWTKHDEDDAEVGSGTITSDKLKASGTYTGRYEHTGLEGGFKYKYHITANSTPENTDGSIPQAQTLGTPSVNFTANSYTDIAVSWRQVVAAEKYQITLGSAGDFGNGVTFVVGADGNATNVPEGLTVSSKYDDSYKTVSLTISKPYGYNNATLSGKAVPLVVEAQSGIDAQNNIKGKSPFTKSVWTIGPAAMNLKATESFAESSAVKPTSITITWQKLEGADGYAVYRMRPEMTGDRKSKDVVEKKDAAIDVYYVNSLGTSVSKAGASVSLASDTFTLVDEYAKAPDSGASQYQNNQQYLAWGIPFTYVVVPVLASSDAADIEKFDDIKPTGEKYANLANLQKIGYTTGYGIALEATKAQYPDQVTLTWELPQSATDKHMLPTIYYRNKGSDGAWTKLETLTNSAASSVDIKTKIDRVQALEYAVTYSDSMDHTASKDIAFAKYQRELKNLVITNQEPKCVGYMFTMPQITPTKQDSTNEDFTETVQWYFYDKEGNRAVGGSDITGYAFEIKNLNCSGAWQPVYTYGSDGVENTTASAAARKNWYSADFTTNTSGQQVTVTATPQFTTNSNNYTSATFHDGILKVLRDYKHYYRISAKRKPKTIEGEECDEITATSEDYAYRKIYEDELHKCVGLICADAFYQTGMPYAYSAWMWDKAENTISTSEGEGTIFLTHKSWDNDLYWGTTGVYRHQFQRLPGEQDTKPSLSAFKLTIPEARGGDLKDHTLKSLPSTTISIDHECGLPSYKGSWNISGTPGSDVFPYEFSKKRESGDKSANTSFYTYKTFWWEVQ